MRKLIVAGNWKMNKTLSEGVELAAEVNALAGKSASDAEVVIAPPFIHLSEVAKVIDGVKLSAQNCASETSGAYTGEVSALMLKSVGAEYVIIGHSERRSYYHEEDDLLARKVSLALENGLIPIFCCGEVLAEREGGTHLDVVKRQVETALFGLTVGAFQSIVIAYEPVWAIGTGVTASSAQAQEMHAYIRKLITDKYGTETADNTSILYGGSCKPSNARELFANPDVDGGLIGGASLKADDFIAIVNSF